MRAARNSNERYVAAYFRNDRDLLAAVEQSREAGVDIYDVYTPFPVHGMDEAMNLRRSRLMWIAFLAGALGLAFGFALQIWTSAYDWPLNTGGKPFNSFPLFIPVTFELTVLFSGLIAIAVLFARNRMWLFSRREIFEGVTDDSFVLVLRQTDAAFDSAEAAEILKKNNVLKIFEGDRFV
jgi:hypothetical protein